MDHEHGDATACRPVASAQEFAEALAVEEGDIGDIDVDPVDAGNAEDRGHPAGDLVTRARSNRPGAEYDDCSAVIALLKGADLGVALQFTNYR